MFILDSYYYIDPYKPQSNWDKNISDELEVMDLLNSHDFITITARHKFDWSIQTFNIRCQVLKSRYEGLKRDFGSYEAIEIIKDRIIQGFIKWDNTEVKDRKKLFNI